MGCWINALNDWGVWGTFIGFLGTLLVAFSINIDTENFKIMLSGKTVSVPTLTSKSNKRFRWGIVLLVIGIFLLLLNEINLPFINKWL